MAPEQTGPATLPIRKTEETTPKTIERFFRRHRFGDDRIRARCDEAHAKARDAAEETKSRDGRHEVLHDEGEADEYRRGDEHPMDDEARRDAAGIERCEGAAAAGNEDNEPDDGRNDGRIPIIDLI